MAENNIDETVLFKQAWNKFGALSQCIVAAEELIEAASSILNLTRHEGSLNNLSEEFADAMIVMDQIKTVYPEVNEMLAGFRSFKIERLQDRVNAPSNFVSGKKLVDISEKLESLLGKAKKVAKQARLDDSWKTKMAISSHENKG